MRFWRSTTISRPSTVADEERTEGATGRMRAFAGNTVDDYRDHVMKEFPLPSRMFMGFVAGLLWGATKLLWPWKIEDAEKLFEQREGCMIIGNHVSMLEPVVLIVHAWFKGVSIRPIYKSEFDMNAPATWFFSRVGGIPVKRGTADMKAVRRARAAMQRGECVLVYPEGTRIKTDDPAPIHSGFALMAQLAKAPVVPMAVVGARDITPAGKHFPRFFVRCFLKVGDAIRFSDLGVEKKKEQLQAMEDRAMAAVWRLRDELRAEHPGKM